MSKLTTAAILAATAAACTGAAGILPEPYHSILLAAAMVLASFGGVFGAAPATNPGSPK